MNLYLKDMGVIAPIGAELSAAQSPPAFYLSRAPPPSLV